MAGNEPERLWGAIGGLRANVQRLIAGQRRLATLLGRIDRIGRKLDLMLYATLAYGGATIGLLAWVVARG